jgi:hypothetical protein
MKPIHFPINKTNEILIGQNIDHDAIYFSIGAMTFVLGIAHAKTFCNAIMKKIKELEEENFEVKVTVDGISGYAYAKYKDNLKHMCGLSGYNPMLGDRCPRCDLDNEAYQNAKNNMFLEKEK